MAVYSETISNEKLLSSIPNGARNILIIGCGGCMNESLAYKKDLPIFKIMKSSRIPYATKTELERISELLKSNGYNTEKKLNEENEKFILCIVHEEYENEMKKKEIEPDVVLALCCHGGNLGLKLSFKAPVINITRQVGCLGYAYKESGTEQTIIKEKSIVHRYDILADE